MIVPYISPLAFGFKSLRFWAKIAFLYFYQARCAQLSGRLFSPSDISKKLSHYFLLHFPIGMGSYDHHAKYQGVFPGLLKNTFFIGVPPLDKENINEFKGGTLMRKVFYRSPGNTP